MKTSQLLITAACSLTMIGAASVAFAQTPSSANPSTGTSTQNQYQNQGQNVDRTSNTAAPGTMNSTTQRQSGTATSSDSTGTTGTTGSRMGRSTDDNTRQSADGSTMRSDRVARADRN